MHYDRTKPKPDDYYDGEIEKFVRGDRVSADFAKLIR